MSQTVMHSRCRLVANAYPARLLRSPKTQRESLTGYFRALSCQFGSFNSQLLSARIFKPHRLIQCIIVRYRAIQDAQGASLHHSQSLAVPLS